jgi:hypothetical protein
MMWAGASGVLVLLAGVGVLGSVVAGIYLMVRLNGRSAPWT